MPEYVFAVADCFISDGVGGSLMLEENEAWAADDPVVKSHPDLFQPQPSKIRRTTAAPVVEQATANPGERRTTRRA